MCVKNPPFPNSRSAPECLVHYAHFVYRGTLALVIVSMEVNQRGGGGEELRLPHLC